MGTNYGNSGLKCSTFQPPVAGISKEDESLCLNSVDVCCKQVYRDKQCKLGQTDATSPNECAALSNDLDGFRKVSFSMLFSVPNLHSLTKSNFISRIRKSAHLSAVKRGGATKIIKIQMF